MKKTSNKQSSIFFTTSQKTSHTRALLFSIFALVLIVCILLWRSQFEGLLLRVAMPIFSVRDSFSTSEVETLREALASTTAALADRNLLYQENIDLKAQLGRAAGLHTLLATVVMRPPQTPYDTAIIDIGSDAGLQEGDLVYAAGSTVIGVVSQTYVHTARITYFSSPGQTYDAILTTHGTSTVMSGKPIQLQGGGSGSLSAQIPSGTTVSVGDSIVLQDIHTPFVATVTKVENISGSSFITLYAHMPVNPAELRFVRVTRSIQ
jgi:cell shape-determining protein MreC